MKTIIIAFSLYITSLSVFSQGLVEEHQQKKNEIQLNVLYPIAFKSVEVSYERLLNEDNTIGLTTLYANYEILHNHYMIAPFVRKYFNRGYAKGFYLELFVAANGGTYDEDYYNSYWDETNQQWIYTYENEKKSYNDVAFGLGAGYKFLSSDHFVGNIHAGIARNMFTNDYPVELIGKGGISIGYRF